MSSIPGRKFNPSPTLFSEDEADGMDNNGATDVPLPEPVGIGSNIRNAEVKVNIGPSGINEADRRDVGTTTHSPRVRNAHGESDAGHFLWARQPVERAAKECLD